MGIANGLKVMRFAVMIKPVTGLVLAGGRSKRMGKNKADLPLGEGTFLTAAQELLSGAGCADIWISAPDHLADRMPGGGPLAGLDAAVAKLKDGDVLLVIPVDMPRLDVKILHVLPSRLAQNFGVYFADQPLPFLVDVRPALPTYLSQVLNDPEADRSLFALFRHLQFQALEAPTNTKDQFWNCNTPADYQQIRRGK